MRLLFSVILLFCVFERGVCGEHFSKTIDISLILSSLEQGDRKRLERNYPNTLTRIDQIKPLSLQDIKNLTRSGVSDTIIIYEISLTRSVFFLTPDDEKELQMAGVSEKVINHMKIGSPLH